ncbi:MAG: hypothetical protein WAR61_18795, partial [Candidatus Microthrix parvicella]
GPPPGMPPQGPPPGQPPGGGYGPPPGGGGFAPPPGGMQGGGGAVDVMAAPSWAFKKFQEDLGIWLILAVIPMIVLILVSGGINFALGLVSSNTSSFILALALNAITTIVGFALFGLAARGLIRAALAATRGEKPTMEHLTDMTDIGPYLVLSAILGLAVGIGTFLCYIPGIIIAVITGFSYTVQLDQKLEPIDAIKKSVEMVQANPGPALGGLILAGFIGQIGIVACCVGIFFTWPIGWMTNVHIYKQLRGEPIAP